MAQKLTYDELKQRVKKLEQETVMLKQEEKTLRESEHKFNTHLQNTPIGAITWDLNFRVIEWNPAAKTIFGYSKKEALGKYPIELIILDEIKEEMDNLFKDLISEKGGIHSTNENITKDGKCILCDWSNTPLKNIDGEVIGVASLVEDITERKQAEEESKKSEENLSRMFQFADYMVCIADLKKGYFTKISPAFTKHLGWSTNEMLSTPILDFIHPADVKRTTDIIKEQMAKEVDIIQFENRYKTKKGDFRWFEWSAKPIPKEGITYSAAYDITERKQMEEVLRENEEKFRNLFENMLEAFALHKIIINEKEEPIDYIFVEVNKTFEQQTGLNRNDIIDKKVTEVLPGTENDPADWIGKFGKVALTGEKLTFEQFSEALSKWFQVFVYSPEKGYFATIFMDITDRKKLENQLNQSQKMESIGTLAGGIAHDFNNILFPVFGYLEMAMEDIPGDSPVHDQLTEVFNGAQRARDLVKQILTFSRQSDHELKPLKTQIVIREALKLLRSSIPSTIKMNQNINKGCGLVMADPTHIHQIIMNLCTNAFHAMEESGGKLNVTLEEIQLTIDDLKDPAMAPGPHICLMVSDTGHGMEQHIIDKIFDPYFTTKAIGKGTGLGLAVIHGIVKDYGGHINIYSEPDKGSEFKIYLPVIQTSKTIVKTENNLPLQKGNERVLLVDDEDTIAQMEKIMLERLGYQVSVRTNSIDALELFRNKPDNFDLVMTDLTMPNMTGDKLAGELIKIRPEIPIILCTGFSETMSEEKAAYLGIKGFLLKPIVTKDLSQKIREVLDEIKPDSSQ